MGDYFTNYALGLQKQAQDNLYNDFAGVAGSIGQSALGLIARDAANPVADRQYSTGDAILTGAITGLLTGGLGQLGANQAADDYSLAQQVLLGQSLSRPEGLSKSLYKNAVSYRDLVKAKMAQDIVDDRRKAGLDLELHGIKGTMDDTRELGMIPLRMQAEEEAKAGLFQGDMKDAGGEIPRPAPLTEAGKMLRDLEDTYYTRVTKLPVYNQFADIDTNFRTLRSLMPLDSPSASVGMIASLARIWDPGSTVREGEFQINSNAQAMLDNVIGDWRQVVMGKGKLSDEAKQNIIEAASAKYNEFGQTYQGQADALLGALEAQGGSRANIPIPQYEPYEGGGAAAGAPQLSGISSDVLRQLAGLSD